MGRPGSKAHCYFTKLLAGIYIIMGKSILPQHVPIVLYMYIAHILMIILLVHLLNAPFSCGLLCLGLQLAGLLPQWEGSGIDLQLD